MSYYPCKLPKKIQATKVLKVLAAALFVMCTNIKHIVTITIALLSNSSVASATGITMGLSKAEGVISVLSVYFIIPSIALFLVYLPINIYLKKHKSEHVRKLEFSHILLVLLLLFWVITGVIYS